MIRPTFLIVSIALFFLSSAAKSRDLYKVLGVDRNASQRDIQKAFHRLSLHYHPDKNKNKGAQEKFAEINNAYEVLSDEEKRKNYDLYGDEKGAPGFDGGNFGGGNYGGHGGYSYFTSSDPHNGHFTFQSGTSSRGNLLDVDSLKFKKETVDQGLTWLLLFYTPSVKGYRTSESLIQDVSISLQGALKVGRVNCQEEQSLCSDHGAWPSKAARIFIYSYKNSEKGELVEYRGEFDSKNLKTFCQEQFPRFSTRHSSRGGEFSFTPKEKLPQVLLLSTKKETPIIWRVLSGLYRKRFKLHDAQVFDLADERVKKFKVNALPAVVGRMSNGEEHVLKEGINVKDLSSGIEEMKGLFNKFERMNKNTGYDSGKESSRYEEQKDTSVPLLTNLNMDTICSESTPLCIIGAFGSTKAREKMEPILSHLYVDVSETSYLGDVINHWISQKTLTRRRGQPQASKDLISYCLLDATKNRKFLESFNDSIFRSLDKLLLAYKPRKGKFAVLRTNELTLEEAEGFVGSALNGDITFLKIKHKPVFL